VRINFDFELVSGSGNIPLDYRRGFMSMLKSAIEKSNENLFKILYTGPHKLKPFTFSAYFPELGKSETKDKIKIGKYIKLNFSTNSYEILTCVYNGILKNRTFPLFQNEIVLKRTFLQPRSRIKSNDVIFKTMSPVLINNKGDSLKYLTPDDNKFSEGLKFCIDEMLKTFLNGSRNEYKIEFTDWKRKVVSHYNQNMTGVTGIIKAEGNADFLNLIYDIGLGVRRSQGFGMLEVVR